MPFILNKRYAHAKTTGKSNGDVWGQLIKNTPNIKAVYLFERSVQPAEDKPHRR